MGMVGEFELAFRLGVAFVAIVAPALCFLGMWRGLDVLKDDQLIARVQQRGGMNTSSPSPGASIPTLPDVASGSTVRCASCGAVNMADTTYCQQCLEKLPG